MFSFSQLRLYQQCPRKFAFKYVWNVLPAQEELSLAWLEGNLLHSALCWLYKQVQSYNIPTQEDLLSWFNHYRQEECSEKNHIDGDDPFIVQAYHNCEKILSDFYQKYYPFDQEMVIALEKNLFLHLDSFIIQAKPDKITKRGDTFVLYDYKTNQKLSSEEEQFHREQLLLYALAVQENYGKYFSHLECCLQYLRLDKEIRFEVTADDLAEISQKYLTLCQEIEKEKEENSESEDRFPAKQGNLCRFCEFASFCRAGKTLQSSSSQISPEQYATWYTESKNKIKGLEEEKELLKQQILEIAKENDFACVYGNSAQITLWKRKKLHIENEEKMGSFLEQKGILEECLSLNEKEVKNFIETNPDFRSFLEIKESKVLRVKGG